MGHVTRSLAVIATTGLLAAGLTMPSQLASAQPAARAANAAVNAPEPAPAPELVPAEDRIPGIGLADGVFVDDSNTPAPSEHELSEPARAWLRGELEPLDAPGEVTYTTYEPWVRPGFVTWGPQRWTLPATNPPLTDMTWIVVRASDNEIVYEHHYPEPALWEGFAFANPLNDEIRSLEPGVGYFMVIAVYNGEWSLGATGPTHPALGTPGLTEAGTRGNCTCTTSTGRDVSLSALRGDPVNTVSGALVESVTDVSLPTVGPAFTASRTYNSTDPAVGMVGRGWSFPYFARLKITSGQVTYVAEDGQEVIYRVHPEGGFYQPLGVTSKLRTRTGGGYELVTLSNDVLTFNASGQLVEVRDPSNNKLTLTYASGRLDTVTDAMGRVFDVAVNAAGLLTSVTLPDGRSVSYGYTGDLLTSVTDMRGGITKYEYDTAGRLEAIIDPLDHEIMRTTYDAQSRVIEQVDAGGGTTTFEYIDDGLERTVMMTDPNGGVTRDLYLGNVLMESETPTGAVTSFRYDYRLRLTATTDPHGRITRQYYYNPATGGQESDYLWGRIYANGDQEKFTYSTAGDVLTETSPEGRVTTYTYDANHRVKTKTDHEDGVTSYTYNAQGQVATVTSPGGGVTTNSYDAFGNLIKTVSPEGRTTTSDYDDAGRLVTQTPPRGNTTSTPDLSFATTYTYNENDQLLTTTTPGAETTTYEYDLAGRQTAIIDPLQRRTENGYDNAGRLTSVTEPGGAVTTHEYDLLGNRTATVDAEGGRTSWTFDADNRVETMTTARGNQVGADPADFTWSYTYDGLGNRLTETDPAGHVVTYGHDERYRQTTVTDQLNKTTETVYDGDGNAISVTNPLGRTSSTVYNGLNLPTEVTDQASKVTVNAYDGDGRLVSTTTPLGNKTSYEYDQDGLLLLRVTPRGQSQQGAARGYAYTYDLDGNQLSERSPALRPKSWTYDKAGRVLTETVWNMTTAYDYDAAGQLEDVTGPDGAVTAYGYTPAGDLETVTDPNQHITTLGYDDAHRLVSSTDPLGRTKQFGYDTEGNQTSTLLARGTAAGADPNRWTIDVDYDYAGRRTAINTATAGSTASFGYDPAGRMTTATDAAGTSTLDYDDAGQLETVTRGSHVYGYTYDPRGMVKTITQPGGVTVTNTFDNDGRLATTAATGSGTTQFGYDANSNITRIDNLTGTGLVNRWQNRAYDLDDLWRSSHSGTGTTTEAGSWVVNNRDPAGRPFVVRRGSGNVRDPGESFGYDAAGRLNLACYDSDSTFGPAPACADSDASITYTYDGAGNRLTENRKGTIPNPGMTTYTYDDTNQLTTRGGVTYAYDADGNQIGDGTTTWAYDELNRLTGIDTASADSQLTYDAFGNRTSVTTGASTRNFSWDINNPLPLLTTVTEGANTSRYRYGPGALPIGATINGTHHAYLTEDLNNVTDIYNRTTGTKTWTSEYEPFGNPRNTTSNGLTTAQVGLTYTGEYLDPTTGLLNLRLRNYNPTTGQFSGADPVRAIPTAPYASQYAYALNMPTVYTDPSGAFACALFWVEDCNQFAMDIAGAYVHEGGIDWGELGKGGLVGIGEAAVESGWGLLDLLTRGHTSALAELLGVRNFYGDATAQYRDGAWTNIGSTFGQGAFIVGSSFLGGFGILSRAGSAVRFCLPAFGGPTATYSDDLYAAITRIERHLRRVDHSPANDAMLARLRQSAADGSPLSEADMNFMRHELLEADLVDGGMTLDDAHEVAGGTHPTFSNYDPEVIKQFPELFNSNWRRYWGLE